MWLNSVVPLIRIVHGLQKERNRDLETRIEALLNERDVLKGRVQQLKVRPTFISPAQFHVGCR